jgi:hypothetical protein
MLGDKAGTLTLKETSKPIAPPLVRIDVNRCSKLTDNGGQRLAKQERPQV